MTNKCDNQKNSGQSSVCWSFPEPSATPESESAEFVGRHGEVSVINKEVFFFSRSKWLLLRHRLFNDMQVTRLTVLPLSRSKATCVNRLFIFYSLWSLNHLHEHHKASNFPDAMNRRSRKFSVSFQNESDRWDFYWNELDITFVSLSHESWVCNHICGWKIISCIDGKTPSAELWPRLTHVSGTCSLNLKIWRHLVAVCNHSMWFHSKQVCGLYVISLIWPETISDDEGTTAAVRVTLQDFKAEREMFLF